MMRMMDDDDDIDDDIDDEIEIKIGGSIIDILKIQNQINNIFISASNNNSRIEYYKTNNNITAQVIVNDIKLKIDTHNIRSREQRNNLLLKERSRRRRRRKTILLEESKSTITTTSKSNNNSKNIMDEIIGPIAAKNNVSLDTFIRASTVVEREYAKKQKQKLLSNTNTNTNNGLHVRDEIGDEINTIIIKIKIKQQHMNDGNDAIKVRNFNKLFLQDNNDTNDVSSSLVCNLTLLCLAKRAVELGAFAIAIDDDDDVDDDNRISTSTNKNVKLKLKLKRDGGEDDDGDDSSSSSSSNEKFSSSIKQKSKQQKII